MKFGQYEILERIACGGMAEVYRGRAVGDEGFEKSVAIKRILPHLARDARFVSMLVTEARIHASLSHRNIVQIQDLGVSEEGEYFIVLEFVDGRDLGQLLDALTDATSPTGRPLHMGDAVALYLVTEIAEGLHFAHELKDPQGLPLGLVHRDISPGNVLLSYAGEVKLSDFGLAKRQSDQSVVASIKGKLSYMSPEQARRSPVDRRTDVFALGAVLFEMLTGRRLRQFDDDLSGWQQVASGLVPSARQLRPDLPPVLAQLLTAALAPDPRDRFADALAFASAARRALDQVPRARQSEGAELQALLRHLLPPGSVRSQSEPSKVIRLVSEFLSLPRLAGAASRAPSVPSTVARPSSISGRPAIPGRAPGGPPATMSVAAALPAQEVVAPRRVATPVDGRAVVPLSSLPRPELSPPSGTRVRRPDGVVPPMAVPSSWRWMVLGFVSVLLVVAGAIHLFIVPLPVLRVWWQPAWLEVGSEPAGASVWLDGKALRIPTPTGVEVRRDRQPHLLELRREGFHSVRRTVRFDRSRYLNLLFSLRAESRPGVQPLPVGDSTHVDAHTAAALPVGH